MLNDMVRWTCPSSMLCAALVCTTAVGQQTGQQAPIRVESRLVLVDLIATDQNGNPIGDIDASQVRVFQDGKQQNIQFFQHFSSDNAGSASDNAPAGVQRAAPAQAPSIAIVIDRASLTLDAMKRTKEALLSFLGSERPDNGRYMLATFSGGGLDVVQPFTGDRAAIVHAIENVEAAPNAESSLSTFSRFSQQVEEVFHGAAYGSDQAAMSANMAATFISEIASRVSGISDAMTGLTQYLSHLPGRKHVILASGGYPLKPHEIARDLIERRVRNLYGINPWDAKGRNPPKPPLPEPLAVEYVKDYRGTEPDKENVFKERMNAILSRSAGPDLNQHLADLAEQANRSRVSIYTVDGRGLLAAAGGGAADAGLIDHLGAAYLADLRDAIIRSPQEFLTDVADQTGGLSYLNSNDLQAGFRRAAQETRSYYLIAYSPPSAPQADGKYHQIRVEVDRPDTSIRYRKGYLQADEREAAGQDVLAALRYPDLYRDYAVQLEVAPEGKKLKVTAFIPSDALRFQQDGGTLRGSLEMYGALFDQSGKWIGKDLLFRTGRRLVYSAEEMARVRGFSSVSMSAQGALPDSGDYELIVVIRQGADGSILAARHSVVVF